MNDTDFDGGPAFPRASAAFDAADGMSLLDWLAGQVLANPAICDASTMPREAARFAYSVAHAALAERKKFAEAKRTGA